jgi:hypothetical protein
MALSTITDNFQNRASSHVLFNIEVVFLWDIKQYLVVNN